MTDPERHLEIRLLGPLEARRNSERLELGSPQSRLLLAVLASSAGQPVTAEALIDRVWDDAPAGARHTLHVQVSALRRLLAGPVAPATAEHGPDRVLRRSGGYVLDVDPVRVDVHRLRAALTAARTATASSSDRLRVLREVRELWRQEPLADLPGRWAQQTREIWRQDQLDAALAWAAAELEAGAAESVVGPLSELASQHRFVEPLTALLMRALSRAGQVPKALEVYATERRLLRDELGIDPGSSLRGLHQSILDGTLDTTRTSTGSLPNAGGTRSSTTSPVWPAPGLLPPDVAGFAGRDDEVAALSATLVEDRGTAARPAAASPTALRLVTVCGVGGIGKTALAVHVAHRARTAFPDGQLYVNLQGVQRPLDAGEVLARFLRALGVDGTAIPEEVEERAALYRASLADKRLLVVLDDALNESQVRPLLPGHPGCAVLVTSRTHLTGLSGAVRTDLPVLEPAAALVVLSGMIELERIGAEPDAAAAIVSRCGGLPLALRIAGSRLAARPRWTLAHLADRLADEHRRLDELSAGDLEVRASIALSYRLLSPLQQRAFRRLGLLDQPDVPAWVVAAVLDLPPAAGEDAAEALVEAHLLDSAGQDRLGQNRYRLHDLLRVFARERADLDDDPLTRQAAVMRVLGGWLRLVERADAQLPSSTLGGAAGSAPRWPGPDADTGGSEPWESDAGEWFETELPGLVAAVDQACALGLDELAWGLAHMMLGFLATRGHLVEWRRTHEQTLALCERTSNGVGEAYMARGLGQQAIECDQLDVALRWLLRARDLFSRLGDRRGLGYTLIALGYVHRLSGRPEDALVTAEDARAVLVAVGDRRGVAYAEQSLGVVHREQGRLADAERCIRSALRGFVLTRDRRFLAFTLRSLGLLQRGQQLTSRAAVQFWTALPIMRELDDRYGQAMLLQDLGEMEEDPDRARALMEQSLSLSLEIRNRFGEARCLRGLGGLHRDRGELGAAESYLRRSLGVWRDLQMPLYAARALEQLGGVQAATGRHPEALSSWREALDEFRRLGAPEAETLAARLGDAADRRR